MRRFKRTPVILGFLLLILWAGPALAELTIGGYTLVDSHRVSRAEYEYTYRAQVTNDDAAIPNVIARASSSDSHTIIIEGQLVFGNVPAGGTLTSTDTFTIRHDRRFPMDWSAVSWEFQPLNDNPGIYYKYDKLGRIIEIQRIPAQ